MSGFVYFVAPEALFCRDGDTQFVKIGYTRNAPESRLSALQTGCPIPLKVYFYTDGSPELEAAFHEAFAPLRHFGEWFNLEYRLHDFMSYFDEPPHGCPYVAPERIEVALYDNVYSDSPPHPSIPRDEWIKSASFEPLARYYPSVLEA